MRTHTLLLFCCFFSFFSCTKQAGDEEIESNILLQEARDSLYTNPDYSLSLADRVQREAKDSITYYEAIYYKSMVYITTMQLDSAHYYNQQIIVYGAKQPLSDRLDRLLSFAYNLFGVYYIQTEQPDSALFYYQKATDLLRRQEEKKSLSDLYINIASVYTTKSDFVNTVQNLRMAMAIGDSIGFTQEEFFSVYLGLGRAYLEIHEYDLSDKYFSLAEKYVDSQPLFEQFICANNRGNYYYRKKEYENALPYFRKAKALVTPGNYQYQINFSNVNLGETFYFLNQLDSARYYLAKGETYFSNIQSNNLLYHIATVQAGIAMKENKLQQVYDILSIYDNLENVEINTIILRTQYLQQYYEQIGNFKNAYHYQRENIKLNDSIRNEQTQMKIAELDMRYAQDTTLLRREIVISKQQAEMESLHLNRLFWIIISILTLSVAVFSYFSFRRKRNLAQIKYQEQVAELRMTNIRNRISPHFVFNVLNREISSLKEQERESLFGLVLLLRRSLEMTEQKSVSLQQELEFVYAYINLETKSFGNEFLFETNIDESINSQEIFLFPMQIQIPVENAIKHALRMKNGEKRLSISLRSEEKGILIEVEDNGDGYRNGITGPGSGTGTGFKVLYQSIQLINEKNTEKISFHMTQSNKPGYGGAKAEIYIPYNYRFV